VDTALLRNRTTRNQQTPAGSGQVHVSIRSEIDSASCQSAPVAVGKRQNWWSCRTRARVDGPESDCQTRRKQTHRATIPSPPATSEQAAVGL